MEAYLAGLEKARETGHDLDRLASVASFFVSRVDSEIDARLDALGTDEAAALRGTAAIANARLAYQHYEAVFAGERWEALAAAGARPQRPLWASTGVKDPAYDDTRYVVDLVAPGTVNTMPEDTLRAVADHGVVTADSITGAYDDAAGARGPGRGGRRLRRRGRRAGAGGGREVRGVLGGPGRLGAGRAGAQGRLTCRTPGRR